MEGLSVRIRSVGNWFTGKKWRVPGLQFDLALLGQTAAVTAFFSWFFYRNVLGILPVLPLGILHYRNGALEKRAKGKRKLKLQFQDLLLSIETNMRAGYSVENAFREAQKELRERYGGRDWFVGRMFTVCQGLEHNLPLEHLLYEFGEESQVEEIMEFGEIFAAAKRSGGRMGEILSSSAQVIGQKLQTEEEIQVLLTAKRMEGKIMQYVPFLLVIYLQITSPDFFDVLYHNLMGIGVMSVLEALYGAAVMWSHKILQIEI